MTNLRLWPEEMPEPGTDMPTSRLVYGFLTEFEITDEAVGLVQTAGALLLAVQRLELTVNALVKHAGLTVSFSGDTDLEFNRIIDRLDPDGEADN